ncbi:MAG: oligosaccharide flippase family protein [Bacteroidales bacterium]|nr:oligosaccharide flippase family protein [Bacteroidales bacterium]
MLADLKKVFSQSIIYALGTMAPKLAGLVLIPLYTKHFPIQEFGVIGLLESTSQILISIFGLSLYYGFFRWYFDPGVEEKRKNLFYTLLVTHVVLGIIGLALVLPFSSNISILLFDHAENSYLIRLMAITSMIQMVLIMPSTLMRVQEKASLYTLANLVQMAIMLVITVYLVVVKDQGVEAIYHAQLFGMLGYIIILSKYIWQNISLKIEVSLLKEIFKFCLPLVISSIAVVLLNQADRYIINEFGQLGDVGLYTVGFRLSNTLNIILVASISFAIQPLVFKKMDDPNNKRFYSKLMTYFVFVIMFFVLGMVMFGKEIVKLFVLREEYYDAYKVIPVLTFAILLNMIKDMALIGLQITKKTSIIATIVIIVSITGILLNLALIPVFNNQGAAWSRLLASAIFLGLVYYFSQKAYEIPYEKWKIILMILLGAALYVPIIFINDQSLVIRLIIKSLLIVSYPFLLYYLGFFEAVELSTLKGAWRKWKNPSDLINNIKNLINN